MCRCDLKSGSEGNESTGSDTGSVESSRFSSSPNRPTGVVGRIMEFKRKQQQANTGIEVYGLSSVYCNKFLRNKDCQSIVFLWMQYDWCKGVYTSFWDRQ